MSYGNCCLVSDIPECTEVVEDRAVHFRKGDAEDLKQCLQALCGDDSLVTQMKAAAQTYICEKYNWDAVVEKTLELYQ